MRLALNLGYWGAGNDADNLALAREAERLGYAVVWAAEAYGSDAATVLAWVAAQTERIDIGSAVFQIPARSPAMTAMTAATLDTLSGGRFRLGLGVSGPQVSEGWHGVRFDKPLARTASTSRSCAARCAASVSRTRGALDASAAGWCRQGASTQRASGPGPHPDLSRRGRSAKSGAHRRDRRWLAGDLLRARVCPRAARADPRRDASDGQRDLSGFDVVPTVPMVVGDDLEACAEPVRHYAALYVGGMGSQEQNFYNRLAVRMGYGEAAAHVQELYFAWQHRDAAAAVPFEFIDRTSLHRAATAHRRAPARVRRVRA